MRHRLFHLFALPLLLAAVFLALVQAWQTPLADQDGLGKPALRTGIQTTSHAPTAAATATATATATAAALSDVGLWSFADVFSDEPEWPHATLPAARAHGKRGTLLAAAPSLWPFRGPDALLRPPTTLPCV